MRGRRLWRSLAEAANSEEFLKYLRAEFPEQASRWFDPVERRTFLKLMGASLALAGVSGCTRQPEERIYPYVKAPENVIPGQPLFYATAMPAPGGAMGLLVESHMGRPTKIEGNPDHPASLGATDIWAQASVLQLYDPDRSQVIRNAGVIRPWPAAVAALRGVAARQRLRRGRGLRILSEPVLSPTLARQARQVREAFPESRWHVWEPVSFDSVRTGAEIAFGDRLEPRLHLDRAEVIVAIDADVFGVGPAAVRYARHFARKRREHDGHGKIRLYVAEPTPSITGAVADHRLAVAAGETEALVRGLARRLGVDGLEGRDADRFGGWLDAVAADLRRHRGRAVIVAGPWQSPVVHAIVHALNVHLGNVGFAVDYVPPADEEQGQGRAASLSELVEDMGAGKVEALIILGSNPVFTAPADLDFAGHLGKVPFRFHLGLYDDETAELCHWHVPQAHYLESWSDVRAFDGTVTVVQPLIAPLYDGRTAHEIVDALLRDEPRSSHDIVRETWAEQFPEPSGERFWRKVLHDGVVPSTTAAPRAVRLQDGWESRLAQPEGETEEGRLELLFRPDPTIWDGRFANNGWLQELPKPITKTTWDNAVLVAPSLAEEFNLSNGDVVELEAGGRKLQGPIWILPGQSPGSVVVHLGYGRRRGGRIAAGCGFDVYPLRTSGGLWRTAVQSLRRTGERRAIACTQDHHSMMGRDLVRVEGAREHGETAGHGGAGGHGEGGHRPEELSLFPDHPYEGYAWGMSIDLSSCIGCNACVIACQAENNVPVVGKDQVLVGREMHWIRIDRYFEGDVDRPAVYFQPVPCMHCERAPCELVCPVNATVHGKEGLNEMVYNRCVGTRYCSNNCPYKVRRFNFHLYSKWDVETLKMLANPDVTIRSRGVMEKCSYCVQRINAARIAAKREDRKIRDGEVVTACQAVCPTEAIVFGDINDPQSAVSRRKASRRDYALLRELGTKPRTTYLSVVRNPNPAIERNEA